VPVTGLRLVDRKLDIVTEGDPAPGMEHGKQAELRELSSKETSGLLLALGGGATTLVGGMFVLAAIEGPLFGGSWTTGEAVGRGVAGGGAPVRRRGYGRYRECSLQSGAPAGERTAPRVEIAQDQRRHPDLRLRRSLLGRCSTTCL
jgi:hypothetical protein